MIIETKPVFATNHGQPERLGQRLATQVYAQVERYKRAVRSQQCPRCGGRARLADGRCIVCTAQAAR